MEKHLRAVALIAFTLVCVAGVIVLFDADVALKKAESKLSAVDIAHTQQLLDKDLVDVKSLLVHVDQTAAQVLKTSKDEQKYLTEWNGQVTAAMSNTNLLISHIDQNQSRITDAAVGTLSAASNTIKDVQPVLAEAKLTVATTNATVGDLDRFITSPDIKGTASNLNTISSNFGVVSTDFKTKFHDVLYPPKCEGKWCWIKTAWPYIKTGVDMAEPSYYMYELLNEASHR